MDIFEMLKKHAQYAKDSYSVELVCQTYGQAQMAFQLNTISSEQFLQLNEMLVRDSLNNSQWRRAVQIFENGEGLKNENSYNSGNSNSGDSNSGSWNSGNYNSGDYNSGNCNSGDYNSGFWNMCRYSNGGFNTESPKIYMFNKPSEWTYADWLDSDARYLLNRIPDNVLEYILLRDMTDEEKEAHPEAETTGGYLKRLNPSEASAVWWRGISDSDKKVIMELPNFDREIFKKITGIDVEEGNEDG